MEGPVSGRRIKRRTIRTIVIVAVIAITLMAVLAGASYLSRQYAEKAKQEEQAQLKATVTQLADKASESLIRLTTELDKLLQSQKLVDLFASGDTEALKAEAGQLQGQIESALKVRLFLSGQYQLDRESKPPLGFASLDLLKQAEQTKAAVDAEVHGFGSDDAHIVIIRPIKNAEGNIAGLLHLSLAVDPYINLEDHAGAGYLELVQITGNRPLVLSKAGKSQYRKGNPVSETIKGTHWSINYWPKDGAAFSTDDEGGLGGKLIYAVLALVVIAGVFLLVRRRQAASDSSGIAEQEQSEGAGIVYAGAVKAIMDGQHPGLEKLIPGMDKMGQTKPVQPLSQGLSGDDITAFAKPAAKAAIMNKAVKSSPASSGEVKSAPKVNPAANPAGTPAASKPAAPEQSEAIPASIFRAYDIRGIAGKTLTVRGVHEIGRAIGSEAKARNQFGIVVGRDGRTSSPELTDSLISGLRATGCDVIDIGMVPTPVLYFATYHLETGSGVMVTGSHNGPEYNGLKIVLDNETLSGDAIQGLHKRIESGDMTSGQGSLQSVDITADYLRRASEDIPVALGGAFKLVVDCGNGVAGGVAPQLYRALGHDVVELYCDIDGSFPNHHPDPSQPGNLQPLIDKIKEVQADLGFAFDGDGDRLGVVDGEGNILWPDRQMMLFARDVLSRNQGSTIIYDVKCSRYLKAIIEASGGKPLMWKTGHSLIKNKMKEINAPLAGEMSGHIFFMERWFGFDDAMYAGARMLEILAKTKTRPAEVFADLPGGIATPELRIPLPEKYHAQFMQALKKKMSFPDAEITDIDGVRADFSQGWGLIRPSNTSPFLIARFEAEDKNTLDKIQSDFRELIRSITPDLKLPF